jgi:plasmid stabilization system protein ParE
VPTQVRITANFQENLESIPEFLTEQQADAAFDRLIGLLFEEVIPNLALFPAMGRDFHVQEPNSDEGRAKLHSLKGKNGRPQDIREYITGDYLLLYLYRDETVFLLSIRHHRQLSFDLRAHWR